MGVNRQPKLVNPAHVITEKEFQVTFRRVAQALGWTCWLTWRSLHSPKGEPDLRLVRPPRYLLVELKRFQGKLTPAQAEAAALLKQCPGVEYYCFWPEDWPEIEKVLA